MFLNFVNTCVSVRQKKRSLLGNTLGEEKGWKLQKEKVERESLMIAGPDAGEV